MTCVTPPLTPFTPSPNVTQAMQQQQYAAAQAQAPSIQQGPPSLTRTASAPEPTPKSSEASVAAAQCFDKKPLPCYPALLPAAAATAAAARMMTSVASAAAAAAPTAVPTAAPFCFPPLPFQPMMRPAMVPPSAASSAAQAPFNPVISPAPASSSGGFSFLPTAAPAFPAPMVLGAAPGVRHSPQRTSMETQMSFAPPALTPAAAPAPFAASASSLAKDAGASSFIDFYFGSEGGGDGDDLPSLSDLAKFARVRSDPDIDMAGRSGGGSGSDQALEGGGFDRTGSMQDLVRMLSDNNPGCDGCCGDTGECDMDVVMRDVLPRDAVAELAAASAAADDNSASPPSCLSESSAMAAAGGGGGGGERGTSPCSGPQRSSFDDGRSSTAVTWKGTGTTAAGAFGSRVPEQPDSRAASVSRVPEQSFSGRVPERRSADFDDEDDDDEGGHMRMLRKLLDSGSISDGDLWGAASGAR